MDEKARNRKRQLAEFAAAVAFFAVIMATPWVVHFASLIILRLDPGATPSTFAIVYRTANDRYLVTGWPAYPPTGAVHGFQTFRLPEPAGFIDGPKMRYSFRVLEDDGSHQLVEVHSQGMIDVVSRYAVQAGRIVPISYRGLSWGYEHATFLPALLIAAALGVLAAWSMFATTSRLTRLQQT